MHLSGNLFIIFVFYQLIIILAKYRCVSKKVIHLNRGVIAYFETPNYPKLLTSKQLAVCNLTFALSDKYTENHLIISTTTKKLSPNSTQIAVEKSMTFLPASSYSLHKIHSKEYQHKLIAQEGFLVFADRNKTWGCPSKNDRKPFALSSEIDYVLVFDNDLFNLSSDYCIWRFTAPEKYGFKVVISNLDNSTDTEIFIRNSTDTFVNKRSVKRIYPYYNEDNYLEIQISNNHDTYFFAYVTIVKKTVSRDKCFTTHNLNTTTWHINTLLFSVLNIKCFYELIIPAATEIVVTIKGFIIEKNVDYIRYTDEYNNSITVDVKPDEDTIFKLFNYNNGSNQRYLFQFSNDGSVASLGNYMTFYKLPCRCAAAVLPCQGIFGITGLMDVNDWRYCGNLRCNFTIQPCLHNGVPEMTLLTFRVKTELSTADEYKGDILKTFFNGNIISELEINYYTAPLETNYLVYFNSSSFVYLEVLTFPSKIVKEIHLITHSKPALPVYELEISPTNPFIVLDLGLYRSHKGISTIVKVTVTKDAENPSLTVVSNGNHGPQLFNNESLSFSYNSRRCFGDINAYTCKINSTEIAILCPLVLLAYPILIIHLQNYRQKGCVLDNYIFNEKEFINSPVVVIATPQEDCLATILIDVSTEYHYYISELWTTSLKENVKVFAGNDTFLFEFNSQTAKKWTSIRLFSYIYTIRVPKKATAYIKLQKLYREQHSGIPYIKVSDKTYSIFSTLFYGTSKNTDLSQNMEMAVYCTFGQNLKFTAIYYNTSKFQLSYNYESDFIYDIRKTGDTFLLKNQECMYVVYSFNPDNQNNDDGVVLLIETVHEDETLL